MYIYFSSLFTINDAFYDVELLHRGIVVRRHDGDIIELDTTIYLARIQLGTHFFYLSFRYGVHLNSSLIGHACDNGCRYPTYQRILCIFHP